MRKNADTELNSSLPPSATERASASVVPYEGDANSKREPDFKLAFEMAASQRDTANQQLCNMQIEMQFQKTEYEKQIAELKSRLGED